jgi:anti-sigma factor RsiW
MDCINKNNKRGVELLTDYCAGTLDPAVAVEIDTHTGECAKCRELVEAQRAVWEMLDAWTPLEVSRNFDARLYARIAAEQAQPAWRQWLRRVFLPTGFHPLWKPAVSLAAAGAVVALALATGLPERLQFTQTAPSSYKNTTSYKSTSYYKGTTVQAAAGVEEIDLDQVQQALDDLELLTPAGSPSPSSRL